jgi:hypothetical protein
MTIAEAIAALTQLISGALSWTPMVEGWIADRSYLEQLQAQKGADFVPTAEDFAPYDARLAAADAAIDANAARAQSGG